ncbi:zinc ribbon domain-containing protein [Sulfolobus sp. S-194]|uniref:zinc ribbon domain-containing protein n=1 Tax=Sulfolobus sp. S-194 TaxID=2512240 RepID=UPI001436DD3F|nr:zinc ribbon domain-containing protein [Sulfolobus sp. S-194]QIW24089.1 zinc ribbon domain-containing protein [Sulfolobus sp. S-194]
MKFCPRCGTPNLDIANYCKKCGIYLNNICPRCGYPNRPEANFCAKCGYPLKTRQLVPITQTVVQQPTRKVTTIQSRKEEKKKLIIISAIAIAIILILLIPLSNINVHDEVIGVQPLTTHEIDNILGGNWVTLGPEYTSDTIQISSIIHFPISQNITAYYQFFGFSDYNLVVLYINFSSNKLAKAFYLNYTEKYHGVQATLNTYPLTILQSTNVIAEITEFGPYIIYVEIYSLHGEPLNYTTTQIEKLINYMEIT